MTDPQDVSRMRSAGRALAQWWRKARAGLVHVVSTPRLREEVGWVLVAKLTELALLFGLLKLLTSQLGRGQYGEYNLAEAAVFVLSGALLSPIHEAYLRDYHGSARRQEARAAGLLLLRWYATATLCVVALVALVGEPLARWAEVAPYTPIAAALVFLCERWRYLGQDLLKFQRRRRAWALPNLSYTLCQLLAIGAAVHFIEPTATVALLAWAATACAFAVPLVARLIRDVLGSPGDRPSGLRKLILTFGVPYSVLLMFQLVQGFGDRFVVKAQLDSVSVGLYVAAYQVSGIPFMLMVRLFHDLFTPVAYQRGEDPNDPVQLWAADRLLLVSIIVQCLLGVVIVLGYYQFGQRLLIAMTSERFVLPVSTIVLLAFARMAQSISQSMQPIFAIHHRVGNLLWFRFFGAVATLVICWHLIALWGLFGAAAGTALSLMLYALALTFGPNGCYWLVTDARRRSLSGGERA